MRNISITELNDIHCRTLAANIVHTKYTLPTQYEYSGLHKNTNCHYKKVNTYVQLHLCAHKD